MVPLYSVLCTLYSLPSRLRLLSSSTFYLLTARAYHVPHVTATCEPRPLSLPSPPSFLRFPYSCFPALSLISSLFAFMHSCCCHICLHVLCFATLSTSVCEHGNMVVWKCSSARPLILSFSYNLLPTTHHPLLSTLYSIMYFAFCFFLASSFSLTVLTYLAVDG